MSNLSFEWKAKLKDGTIIFQFDSNKVEHKFQEVLDKIDELIEFSLYSKEYHKLFIVDLIAGIISNKKSIISTQLEKKQNIRLIYFRRNIVNFSENFVQLSKQILYFLGLQYQDKNGNNHKIILKIDEFGNFIIGE